MLTFTVHVWILWLLYAGTLSDKNITGCEERPCQNGGVCERHSGGSRCLCSRQSQNGRLYGGDTCTVELSGCDANQCVNGGICSPLLVDGEHTYTCLCLAGFTGPTCQTPTVFSFESRGYMYIDTQFLDPEAPVNVTFSFRTDRLVGTLLQHRTGDLLLSVELRDGYLCLQSCRGQGSRTLVQELLPQNLSNSKWHTVEASLSGPVSLIRLICTEGNCTRNTGTEVQLVEQAPALPTPGTVQQSLFIGAVEGGWDPEDEADHPPGLLGCFRDVFVGSHLVVPVRSQADFQANMTLGCSDRDKCTESPCQNRGRCVSHGWRSYSCECHRPYEGTDCTEGPSSTLFLSNDTGKVVLSAGPLNANEPLHTPPPPEYVTARFGNKDLQSYAVFSLDDYPGDAVTVSMFIRTRQPRGLLLVLANSTSQYLRLWMEEGRVKVQVNSFETLVGRAVVNDGHFHLVTVKLEASMAFLFQSTQIQATMPVRNIQAHQGDQVFLGGLPDPRASASFGGYFKGCVQDLRVNSRRLQFYPISTSVESYHLRELVNVERGCSSDNACAVNPCLNDGVCYSMWDDFICNCPPNTAGQRCEEVKWCALSPCPTSAVCQPRSQGFECLSNVTFRAESRPLHYQSNGKIKRSLDSVSLSFRTRQSSATLLHAQKDSDFLTVSVQDSHLVLDLQVGVDRTAPHVTSLGPVSDGEWHTMELNMENHTFPNSPWTLNLGGGRKELLQATIRAGALDFLRDSADIFLGGMNLDAGAGLSGCLGPVNIGGILLPFHPDSELNLPRPQEEQFVRVNMDAAPRYGCWGSSVCTPNPCQNQGICEDLFDLHHCTCPPEWMGALCRDPADSCISSPCIHGNCINLSGRYKCACESGFRGERCEVEVDMCENSNCSSGATCLKGFQSYSCLCPQNLTGQYCSEKLPEIPWYIEINPLPQLPVSTCMGRRWNYSCFNGGNCSNKDNACSCLPGFTGEWCEKDVDECASEPCMNGGFCLNYINSFECVCDMNYSGIHCQMDISDFYLYLFLGLWQNLFQLVSYLVMRLDDEPEIEWGFNFND